MNSTNLNIYFLSFVLLLSSTKLLAQDDTKPVFRPDSHAPIGVMGDHTHTKGEFMVSYRFMHMSMEGSRIGTSAISTEEIVSTIPNRFAGMPGQPPTLRIVPLAMDMNMHMFGVMYAPSDWITLMAMLMVVNQDMSHATFQGGTGTAQLGTFVTQATGLGDTRLSALIRVLKKGNHHLHLNAGLSIPTGSITEEDNILTPMDMRPTVRIPYPMQLGSGTFDLLPGFTYTGYAQKLAWGAQMMANLRLGENDEDYSLGNRLDLTAWASYRVANWLSGSFRTAYFTLGEIEGQDSRIMGPVQTANPDFQGGQRIDLSWGINVLGTSGLVKNHRLAFEFGLPVYQDLNGPQMETDYTITLGWQYAF